MTDRDDDKRNEIFAKLAQSREELRFFLDPPRPQTDGSPAAGHHPSEFPRSRTMQALLSGRGLGALGAIAGGLLIARPSFALRLLRMLPASAVARMLITRAFSALRAKQE